MSTKPTNPKDIIGSDKLPLHLVPSTAIAFASLAHLEGACKYGRFNWRSAGVRSSIYVDALERHISRWFNGEDLDNDSGLHHLAHASACINILIDSMVCGKLEDDRPPAAPVGDLIKQSEKLVKLIKEKYADRNPKHYTIADSKQKDNLDQSRHPDSLEPSLRQTDKHPLITIEDLKAHYWKEMPEQERERLKLDYDLIEEELKEYEKSSSQE